MWLHGWRDYGGIKGIVGRINEIKDGGVGSLVRVGNVVMMWPRGSKVKKEKGCSRAEAMLPYK